MFPFTDKSRSGPDSASSEVANRTASVFNDIVVELIDTSLELVVFSFIKATFPVLDLTVSPAVPAA